ncbi:MAG: alpha/beta fold hydrolase [Planctomycetota bacterium]
MPRPRAVSIASLLLVLALRGAGGTAWADPPGGPAVAAPPLTVEAMVDGPALTVGGPPIASWRPGRDAWVEWRDRALFEVDAATGTATRLVGEDEAAAARGDARSVPMRGIGRAGPPSHLWARGGEVVLLPVGGDVVAVDLVRGTRARLTRTTSPLTDVVPSPAGDAVAFSRDGELWVGRAGPDGPVETRRTFDGSDDLLNATLDWVYPEELDVTSAIQWSPDGTRLAFLRLDERRVPKVAVGDPMPLHGATTLQRYPKAGDPNPVPSVCVVGRDAGAPVPLALGRDDEVYVPWFRFTPDGRHVLVAVMPRDQKSVEVVRCDPGGGPTTVLWRDEDPRWVDVPDPPRFLADGASAIVRSRRGGWWRLWRVRLADGTATPLTPDGEDAGRVLAVDEAAGAVFCGAEDRATLRSVVVRAPLAGGPVVRVTDAEASHTASFSTTGRVFLDDASRLDRPSRYTVRRADGTAVREAGDAATPAWAAAALPAPALVRLPGEPALVATVRTPRAFDAARRWPVVFHVYGGPGSRLVRDAFDGGLFDAVLAEAGFVVVRVDGRGTSGRGKDHEAAVAGRLGTCEVEDLVAAVDRLAAEPWFDRGRVGVWGWSYGGTVAALAAGKAPDTFRAAVAVAPVTDWRLYDTIYTERYMGRPDARVDAYREAAATTHAKDVRGALLLAHGLADDNVHAQNTWWMVKALVAAGRPFDLQVYPEKGHGLEGRDTRVHVHRRVLDHFARSLGAGPR